MSTMRDGSAIRSVAGELIERTQLLRNPYFVALQSGEMTLAQFRMTQQQFYWAVLDFPRAMLLLLARLPRPELRLGILDNVVEEHGHFQSDAFHESTFRQFLASIGVANFDVRSAGRGPEVNAFLLSVMAACQFEPSAAGAACLGVIELAFADISAIIGRAVIERGWLPGDQLVHYKRHAEIDDEHAAQLFAVAASQQAQDATRESIQQGLELGVYVFDRLYRDLWTRVRECLSDGNLALPEDGPSLRFPS